MASADFAIRADESLDDAVRRLISWEIDRVEAHLQDEKASPDARIHGARKRFKEIRAILRLVRPALGTQFVTENRWYRDAGKEFSRVRDARALIAAAATLQKGRSESSRRAIHRLTRVLRARRLDAIRDVNSTIETTLRQLPAARARLLDWPEFDNRFSTIAGGLISSYRSARRARKRCVEDRSPERFHEWRKRMKDHASHLSLLREVWPAMMKANHHAAAEVARLLGDRHDLTVLRELIEAEPEQFGDSHDLRWLNQAVTQKLHRLDEKALAAGELLLVEKPERWRRRLKEYWDLWRNA